MAAFVFPDEKCGIISKRSWFAFSAWKKMNISRESLKHLMDMIVEQFY